MWPFSRKPKHEHRFVVTFSQLVIWEHYWGRTHIRDEEVVMVVEQCSCGERRGSVKSSDGSKELDPVYILERWGESEVEKVPSYQNLSQAAVRALDGLEHLRDFLRCGHQMDTVGTDRVIAETKSIIYDSRKNR